MSTGGRSYESDVEPGDQKVADKSKISYGHKFAQTEELYAAHQMERELEELARQDGMLEDEEKEERRGPGGGAMHLGAASEREEKRDANAKRPAVKAAEGRRLEDVTRGAPIGALPTASEPPPRQGLSEVVGDAQRYAGMIRDSVKDFTTATMRLLKLPVDLAVIASQRLRPARS